MNIPQGAQMRDLTIQGTKFRIPLPFVAGHTLKENEASVLNQTFAENIRNNFASVVEKAQDEARQNGGEADVAALQAELDGYVGEYEFGVQRGGGARLDPVEREARDIAETRVLEAAAAKGIKKKDIGKEQLDSLVSQALEKYPDIMQTAQQIVQSRRAATQKLDLDFGASA